MTYSQLLNRAIELLDEEGPEAAYQFIKEEGKNTENANKAQIYNFTYCFAALSGRVEEALGLMKEAIYNKGFWYDYDYLMEDEDLEDLRSGSEFATMAQLCRQRQQAAQKNAKPILVNDGIESGKPFMMVLHGDQQNAAITAPYWQGAKELGYGLGFAQSSQIQVSDGYIWDDEKQAVKEVKQHWNALAAEGADVENSILCGFSSGGRAALYAALTGAVKPKALILVAPWLPELEEWTEDLSALKKNGTKLYLFCGGADEDCFDDTAGLFEILDDNGIDADFKLYMDLDHDYPEDFGKELKEAVEFFNE